MNDLSLFLDIIVCIDVSANMNPVFEKIKQFTLSLPSSIKNYMQDIPFDNYQLRIKIITFRDYGSDSEPMTESPFYTFPDQSLAFKSFVDSLKTKRFSNGPKNALEAISLALKSDWTTEGNKRRHAVFVFTNSPIAHFLAFFSFARRINAPARCFLRAFPCFSLFCA